MKVAGCSGIEHLPIIGQMKVQKSKGIASLDLTTIEIFELAEVLFVGFFKNWVFDLKNVHYGQKFQKLDSEKKILVYSLGIVPISGIGLYYNHGIVFAYNKDCELNHPRQDLLVMPLDFNLHEYHPLLRKSDL